MTKEEALKLVQEALNALENISAALRDEDVLGSDIELMLNTISKIHAALAQSEQYTDIVSDGGLDPRNKFDAQPEQEPVGFAVMERPWVGLTEQEKQEWIDAMPYDIETRHCMILVNVIEAKLKEKNT